MTHGRVPISRGLPPSDLSLIQKSFLMMASKGEQIVLRFYDVLFERFPELQSFFRSSDLSQQHAKFLNGLRTLVSHLDNPQKLRSILIRLGERHQSYGVEFQHYPPVLDTLLQVLTESGGRGIDGKTYEAWANFLHLIRAIMLEKHHPDSLPLVRKEKSHSTIIADHTKRILLIDDDRQLLDLYQSYLEIQGYLCSQVSDVAWAFTHLHMSYYDLVLTDFQMPVMNGIQMRKNLDYLGMEWCPPFVLMTGSLSQEIRKHALESGFVAVLRKPHDLNELGAIIRIALKSSSSFPGNEGYSTMTGSR